MGLQSFEDGLGRMVTSVFSRASKAHVRPIEIGRRLIKEIDTKRAVDDKGRRVVPNHFIVRLCPADHSAFADIEGALIIELVQAVNEYCADEGYHLRGSVVVILAPDQQVAARRIEIDSQVRKPDVAVLSASITLPDNQRIILGKNTITIGRLAECEVVFDDPNISRRHAEIKSSAEGYIVSDLGSTNGTAVNDVTITLEHSLRDGDIISVGGHCIHYTTSYPQGV